VTQALFPCSKAKNGPIKAAACGAGQPGRAAFGGGPRAGSVSALQKRQGQARTLPALLCHTAVTPCNRRELSAPPQHLFHSLRQQLFYPPNWREGSPRKMLPACLHQRWTAFAHADRTLFTDVFVCVDTRPVRAQVHRRGQPHRRAMDDAVSEAGALPDIHDGCEGGELAESKPSHAQRVRLAGRPSLCTRSPAGKEAGRDERMLFWQMSPAPSDC
jgi:hypothetical protein